MSEGTAKELEICGRMIKLGDYVEVKYSTGTVFKGRIVKGIITELQDENSEDIEVINPDGFKQAQINHGWCFHDHDEILEHTHP